MLKQVRIARILGNRNDKWKNILQTQNQQFHNRIHISSSFQLKTWNSSLNTTNKCRWMNSNRNLNTHSSSVSLKVVYLHHRKVNLNIVSRWVTNLRRYHHIDNSMVFNTGRLTSQSNSLGECFNRVKLNQHNTTTWMTFISQLVMTL